MSQDNLPKTTKQWNVVGQEGFDSLKYSEVPVPAVGDTEVLVQRKVTPRRCFAYCMIPLWLTL